MCTFRFVLQNVLVFKEMLKCMYWNVKRWMPRNKLIRKCQAEDDSWQQRMRPRFHTRPCDRTTSETKTRFSSYFDYIGGRNSMNSLVQQLSCMYQPRTFHRERERPAMIRAMNHEATSRTLTATPLPCLSKRYHCNIAILQADKPR